MDELNLDGYANTFRFKFNKLGYWAKKCVYVN